MDNPLLDPVKNWFRWPHIGLKLEMYARSCKWDYESWSDPLLSMTSSCLESSILREVLPCVWEHERCNGSVLRVWCGAWWWYDVSNLFQQSYLYCSLKEDWRHGFTWKVDGQMEKLWLVIYFKKDLCRSCWRCTYESWILSRFFVGLERWMKDNDTENDSWRLRKRHDFLPVGDNRLQYRSGHLQRFLHCGAHRVSCDDVQLPEPLMRVWTGGEWSSGRIYGDETSKIKTDIL